MAIEISTCNKINETMKNKIINIIKESFKQKDRAKYVRDKLKILYLSQKWNVYYIYQNDTDGCEYAASGSTFICKYRNYRIIINPSENTSIKNKNDSKDEKDFEKFEDDINLSNIEISDVKIKLNEYENDIKKYKSMNDELNFKFESSQKIILEKEKEIEKLKLLIQSDNRNNLSNETFYKRDQMLALNFISSDQKLHFAIPCLNKDVFVDVERKLYEQFPEYKETNNNFLVNAKMILRFKTVEENNLQSGIPILIIINQNL